MPLNDVLAPLFLDYTSVRLLVPNTPVPLRYFWADRLCVTFCIRVSP